LGLGTYIPFYFTSLLLLLIPPLYLTTREKGRRLDCCNNCRHAEATDPEQQKHFSAVVDPLKRCQKRKRRKGQEGRMLGLGDGVSPSSSVSIAAAAVLMMTPAVLGEERGIFVRGLWD
jgi:hypothetical protein